MFDIIFGMSLLLMGIAILVEGLKLMIMSNRERLSILDQLNSRHDRRMKERKFVEQLHKLSNPRD